MKDRNKLTNRLVGMLPVKRVIGILVLCYAALMVFAYTAADRIIFRPHPPGYAESDDLIWLHGADGKAIAARWYGHPDAAYTMLFSHGNYGDLGDIDYDVKRLQALGISILAYDYQGYGISEGKATAANACRDAETALKYLVEDRGISCDRIVLHGRSAGGGPTLYLASRHRVAGVILESTFTSAFRVVTRIPIMPVDKFRNIREITKVRSPVLVIHGANDRTIPISHGKALYRNAPEPKMHCWLPESNHDVMSEEDRRHYENAITDFLAALPALD